MTAEPATGAAPSATLRRSRSRPRRNVTLPSEAVALKVLEAAAALTDEDRKLIRQLSVFRESIQAGQPFWRDDQPVSARVILSGWACRQRAMSDGRRQIFGFLIPGDSVGLGSQDRPLDEVSTVAITRVECIDALMLREILAARDERHARLKEALAALCRNEELYLLDHVVRLGRQSAAERVAHLFLELSERCRTAGLSEGERFPMPLSQEVLADALGLSVVHLNRTLQQMKRECLIAIKGGWLTLLDAGRLTRQCDFKARYGRSRNMHEPGAGMAVQYVPLAPGAPRIFREERH